MSKYYWPCENIAKRDLINYYYQISSYILLYIKDRPQTLYRFPNGITRKSFYQKNVKRRVPEWIDTFTYYNETDEREKEFIVANEEAVSLYKLNFI